MAIYSIKDIEQLSGIKAHTIRIWEQRYAIVTPQRTPSNIRYYTEEDLKHVLNIALLNRNGYKISKIAKMSPGEIIDKVRSISKLSQDHSTQLDALTLAMIDMNEYDFDRIIRDNTERYGFEHVMIEIILPFLEKLTILWMTGSTTPAQENFITFLIRQKIISATDSIQLGPTSVTAAKSLIYLPEGDNQELLILFLQYMMRVRGIPTIYLGTDVPLDNIEMAYKLQEPKYIFTFLNESFSADSARQYIDVLQRICPESQVLLSGYAGVVYHDAFPSSCTILNDIESTRKYIDTLSARMTVSS